MTIDGVNLNFLLAYPNTNLDFVLGTEVARSPPRPDTIASDPKVKRRAYRTTIFFFEILSSCIYPHNLSATSNNDQSLWATHIIR